MQQDRSAKSRVLVVDDDPDIATLCRLQLEIAGFDVDEALTGLGGLEQARSTLPDLVVLDFMLPDIDGLKVLEELRADERTTGIPVVMLTARTHERDEVAAWEAGIVDFVTKPFERDRFVGAVSAALYESEVQRLTRRTAALERLRGRERELARQMAAIVENADDAVIGKNLAGQIVSWNAGAERLYGWTAEEVVGLPVSVLTPAGHADEIPAILERIAKGEHVANFETVRQCRDGRLVQVSLTVSPVLDREGQVIGASAIARDVTDRNRAESWLRALVEGAPDAIVITDQGGRIVLVNAQAETLFGYDRDDLTGQPVELLIPDRYREHHVENREAYGLLPTRRPMGGDLALHAKRADGSEIPVDISLTPLVSPGEPTEPCYAATIRDVTQARRVEERFRQLLDQSPDALIGVDAQGRILMVNARAETLFGYTREELVGRAVELLVPESLRPTHPSLRNSFLKAPRVGTMAENRDVTARRRDGSEFPAELTLSAIETEDGPLVTASVRDVSYRRRSEQRFRMLLESAPDAMVIVDADGRIELVNAQTLAMFGYERDELVGQPVELLLPQRLRAKHPRLREDYTLHPRLRPMGAGLELNAVRKGGAEFPVEVSLGPMQSDDGVSVSAAIRDVSQRKQAEAAQAAGHEREREASRRLREVDRLRTDFLSTVSHELRTPLTAIKGFADFLVGAWEETPEPRKLDFLERIARAANRLDHLVEDLLDFSKLERGQLRIELVPHRLDRLVADSQRRLSAVLEEHRVEVDVSPDLWVVADETAFARVLENLLTNAAKFSPAGSTITVTGVRDGEEVVLSVRDEGVGIPPSEHARVFERFYRVPSSADLQPGTGIGLAIVKQFTEAQRGRVSLVSELGHGSEFRLHLVPAPAS